VRESALCCVPMYLGTLDDIELDDEVRGMAVRELSFGRDDALRITQRVHPSVFVTRHPHEQR